MADDTTLHFDHAATHPAVVYVPQHVMEHATPMSGVAGIVLGLVLGLVACALLTRSHVRWGKRVGVALALLATVVVFGGTHRITSTGTFVGYLPQKSHDMGLGMPTPGDNSGTFFVSQENALKQAKENGDDQGFPASTARTAALKWDDIPAQYRAHASDSETTFPDAGGWRTGDRVVVRDYLKKTYGITLTHTDENQIQNYQEAVALPGPDLRDDYLDHSTLVDVPGNPLHVEGEYEHYQCVLHLEQYRHNAINQPVSAKPGKVECFSSYDTRDITSHTRRVFPKKLQ